MKKVLIYRSEILQKSETFIINQAKALKKYKPEFLGLVRNHSGISLDGYVVETIDAHKKNLFLRSTGVIKSLFLLEDSRITKKIIELEPDIVHAHFGVDALNIFPSVRRLKIPMVVTLHGYDVMTNDYMWKSGKMGLKNINYRKNILKMADYKSIKFICVSEALKTEALKIGIPEKKINVIYTGINVDKNLIRSNYGGRNEILFVGRLVEKKGVPILLYACEILKQCGVDYKLNIIGDGPDSEKLKKIAFDLNINVCFLGEMNFSGVDAFMRRATVFCLPSIRAKTGDAEGFGMVLLEAQARGIPVISSAFGGASEGIIDGVTGYSFTEGNFNELANLLKNILLNNNRAIEMGDNAYKFVKNNFDINNCSGLIENLYDEMILNYV